MRHTRTKVVLASLVLAVTAACGGSAGSDEGGADTKVEEDAASKFDDGTYMKELAEKGTISVGVKFDQPGLGFKGAADDVPTGFDVEIAKLLVASLGIDPDSDKVNWVETVSDNREPFLSRTRSTWCSRRTPSPTNVGRWSGRPGPTWSPASSCW